MVCARPHHDHRATLGIDGGLGKLAGDPDGGLFGHTGDLLLPGRGALAFGVEVSGRPLPRQSFSRDPVLGQEEVVDRRDAPAGHVGRRHSTTLHSGTADVVFDLVVAPGGEIEAGQQDLGGLGLGQIGQGQ